MMVSIKVQQSIFASEGRQIGCRLTKMSHICHISEILIINSSHIYFFLLEDWDDSPK